MRYFLLVALLVVILPAVARADSLADVCHASSSYDLSVATDGLTFDRAQPVPRTVWMHAGTLRVDGANAALNTEDRDRLTLFEDQVRTLVPKVKNIATQGVDLAAQAVRQQAATLAPTAAAGGALDQRMTADVIDIKARIARSTSTHDFQGSAFDHYAQRIATDIVPLVAADMAQQAITAAMSGDLQGAAQLRDQALDVANTLEAKVRQSLQPLRPQIQALCPDIQSLDSLESGITAPLPAGDRLNLIDIGAAPLRSGTR